MAGLPVAVHDDPAEARAAAAHPATFGEMPSYRRILATGGVSSPADAVVVGTEASVRKQLQALTDAGATDIWAAVFAIGDTPKARSASALRTRELLRELVDAPAR